MKNVPALISVSLCLITQSAAAMDSGTIRLQSDTRIERQSVAYDCGAGGRLTANYINADPNFLAILPVPGQSQAMVFVSVIAGSGVRYSANKYVWWTKGDIANLYDTTLGDNAAPIKTCTQIK